MTSEPENKYKLSPFVDELLGYVYCEDGIYEPHELDFTVVSGKRVEIGDVVCIEHPSRPGTPVFYQVVEVPLRRKARDYEEDLLRIGRPLIDPSRDYPRARIKQIGFYGDMRRALNGRDEEVIMLIEHVSPLAPVYRPKEAILKALMEPSSPSIKLGRVYPSWKVSLKLELPKLLRQGLLVVGGVGTGKTTTLLTVLREIIREIMAEGGKPHILVVDKDGEYGSTELIKDVGEDRYLEFHIEDLYTRSLIDKEKFAEKVLFRLGYPDKRSSVAREVYQVIKEGLSDEALELSLEFFKERILPKLSDKARAEVLSRLDRWAELEREASGRTSLEEVVEAVKDKVLVRLDLSRCRDFNEAFELINELLRRIYDEALRDESFGCVVAIDEAHLFCPERGGIELSDTVKQLRSTLELIATTGPRNGMTPFMATQRPSLISKTITTQLGQNIIAHKVEDVDLERISEIMGPIARRVLVLPRGWAIVKSLAAKIREPLIVRIEASAKPTSAGKTAYEKFISESLRRL